MTDQTQNRIPINVKEDWTLQDTVVIRPTLQEIQTPGFFASYAAVATQNEIPFFNVRNRTIGIFWNNQDARDVMPYGFYLHSIGVQFWAPSMRQINFGENVNSHDGISHHTWVCDVPWHLTGILQVQQDEVLKVNAAMLPPGMGFYGDGVGHGIAALPGENGFASGIAGHHDSFTQGMPELKSQWVWPVDIEIPRRANISFKLVLNEYIRNVLSNMNNWSLHPERNGATNYTMPGYSGIRVVLKGFRLAQQRGELHA